MNGPPQLGEPGPSHPGPHEPGRPSAPAPERRSGGEKAPWPWWAGIAALATAYFALQPVILIVLVASGIDPRHASPPVNIATGFLLQAALLGAALGFAALSARPRPWHFGLRSTALWPAVGFSALGMGCFFAFAFAYERVSNEDVRQDTLRSLGVTDSLGALVVVGVLVVVVAPLVEETFFRGFLYRGLRTRLGVAGSALIAGGLFGVLHAGTGVSAIPPLVVLGVAFCLVVERTGSLYPTIAMHAVNNALAYSASPEAPDAGWMIAVPLAALVIAACVALGRPPRRARPAATQAAPAPG